MSGGLIPVLMARGRSVAQAWENALVELWSHGYRGAPTQYDQAGNPPSIDATMTIVIEDPLSEPRFHKCIPGGPADVQEYRMEVLDGIKDHWIDRSDPSKWQYTYHERMTRYQVPVCNGVFEPPSRNQIQSVIDQLVEAPHTRRAQFVTWQPWCDPSSKDPPCWRSAWFRILTDEDGKLWLHMNVDFRSRDGYKAAMMNLDVEVEVMRRVAVGVSGELKRSVYLGRLVDKSDSFHIYGADIPRFESEFLMGLQRRPFADRTATTEDWSDMMVEAIPTIEAKVKQYDEEHKR